jgi:hypothetical protein
MSKVLDEVMAANEAYAAAVTKALFRCRRAVGLRF